MQVSLDPILFYIGSFAFRWYNLILAISLAIGLGVLLLEAKRLGLPRAHAVRIYLWSLLFVAVFGKLFIFWDKWDYYSECLPGCSASPAPGWMVQSSASSS